MAWGHSLGVPKGWHPASATSARGRATEPGAHLPWVAPRSRAWLPSAGPWPGTRAGTAAGTQTCLVGLRPDGPSVSCCAVVILGGHSRSVGPSPQGCCPSVSVADGQPRRGGTLSPRVASVCPGRKQPPASGRCVSWGGRVASRSRTHETRAHAPLAATPTHVCRPGVRAGCCEAEQRHGSRLLVPVPPPPTAGRGPLAPEPDAGRGGLRPSPAEVAPRASLQPEAPSASGPRTQPGAACRAAGRTPCSCRRWRTACGGSRCRSWRASRCSCMR